MIRGVFAPHIIGPRPAPVLLVFLILPEHSDQDDTPVVEFLLDTGAAESCLFPVGAQQLGYEPAYLENPDSWLEPQTPGLEGLGGGIATFRQTVTLGLADDNCFYIMDVNIHIAQATESTSRLPSVLGWDVLRHFNIRFDHKRGIVTLTALRGVRGDRGPVRLKQ